MELWIYTDKPDGHERKHVWQFVPVDVEEGYEIIRDQNKRATGAEGGRAFAIKETFIVTVGAGTLRATEHRGMFMRLLVHKRLMLIREVKGKSVPVEFELRLDESVRFEYLRDLRSLRKKQLTLVEKHPTYYIDFETYLKDRLGLPG